MPPRRWRIGEVADKVVASRCEGGVGGVCRLPRSFDSQEGQSPLGLAAQADENAFRSLFPIGSRREGGRHGPVEPRDEGDETEPEKPSVSADTPIRGGEHACLHDEPSRVNWRRSPRSAAPRWLLTPPYPPSQPVWMAPDSTIAPTTTFLGTKPDAVALKATIPSFAYFVTRLLPAGQPLHSQPRRALYFAITTVVQLCSERASTVTLIDNHRHVSNVVPSLDAGKLCL